jgi:hypothetical protein
MDEILVGDEEQSWRTNHQIWGRYMPCNNHREEFLDEFWSVDGGAHGTRNEHRFSVNEKKRYRALLVEIGCISCKLNLGKMTKFQLLILYLEVKKLIRHNQAEVQIK